MTAWFGESWGAPVCEPRLHVETPVGEPCCECDVAIAANDQGFLLPYAAKQTTLVYHRVCFLRTVIPCAQWPDELLFNMPKRWSDHMAEKHGR